MIVRFHFHIASEDKQTAVRRLLLERIRLTKLDSHTACKRALSAFELAWNRLLDSPGLHYLSPLPPDAPQLNEFTLHVQIAAVEALTWARAFDDAATGYEETFNPLPGYPPHGTVPLLLAARYAANKGIHVLAEVTEATVYPTLGPYGMAPFGGCVQRPIFRWCPAAMLPPPGKMDKKTRPEFVSQWSNKTVVETVDETRTWLLQWDLMTDPTVAGSSQEGN